MLLMLILSKHIMKFSRDYAGVLKKYRVFRESIWAILNSLKNEILESYEVEWDGMDYEQGNYFFHRFQAGNKEISPGVKVSEEYIIKPVFWVTKATLEGAASEKLGFKEDPEFKSYLIRELELQEEFFEESPEEQKEEILRFFRDILEGLEVEGAISSIRAPNYYVAG